MDWTELRIVLPTNEAKKMMASLRDESEFSQLDEEWTVMKRERDHASLSYAPVPVPEPEDPKTGW